MTPTRRHALPPGAVLVLAALLSGVATSARAQAQPPHPFAPTWANLAGARVFQDKGCGLCHAIRGFGATAGPDLSKVEQESFFAIGAAMSNHLRGVNIRKPPLSPDEVTSLIAFIFTLQYHGAPGDPTVGERLFTSKGCALCHEVGGKGGRRGPSLDFLKRADSPVLVAAALWNHGPEMSATLGAHGIERPTFDSRELNDIIAYIVTAARDGGGPAGRVTPGSPERGAQLVVSRQCVACHTVGGKGGNVGPPLGRGQHVGLTQFAARMWNHGPSMWARMRERNISVPRLAGQDMADIVAYLYVSHYFDEPVDPARGRRVAQAKGCLDCHAVPGTPAKGGAPLASYKAARSSSALVASLWNHPRYLERERREVDWPLLSGQELADMAAYMATLPPAPASKN